MCYTIFVLKRVQSHNKKKINTNKKENQTMSDKIGVIGQKYEDRKSKKSGVLIKRDVENKKLSFLDDKAEPFHVTFAAFKSNWRKVIDETPVAEEPNEDTIVEENEVETVEPATTPVSNLGEEEAIEPEVEVESNVEPEVMLVDEDSKIKDFVKALTDARVASVDIIGDTTSIMADDITICTLDKVENGYKMFMLPDIYIFAKWGETFKAGDVHFNVLQGRHRGIVIDCVKASLGDILQIIKTAAVEINLYGYID
jgi:hypothetical protein